MKDNCQEMEMIDHPKTLHELLQNIKTVSTEATLLHESDYTDENLLKIFGAHNVEWQSNEIGKRRGYFKGIDHFIEKLQLPNGNIFEGVSIAFGYLKKGEGAQVAVTISFSSKSNVFIPEIEDIFGKNWQLNVAAIKARVMQRRRIFKTPTHEMGNQPIQFELNLDTHKGSISMELAEDGSLSVLELRIEVEAQ